MPPPPAPLYSTKSNFSIILKYLHTPSHSIFFVQSLVILCLTSEQSPILSFLITPPPPNFHLHLLFSLFLVYNIIPNFCTLLKYLYPLLLIIDSRLTSLNLATCIKLIIIFIYLIKKFERRRVVGAWFMLYHIMGGAGDGQWINHV